MLQIEHMLKTTSPTDEHHLHVPLTALFSHEILQNIHNEYAHRLKNYDLNNSTSDELVDIFIKNYTLAKDIESHPDKIYDYKIYASLANNLISRMLRLEVSKISLTSKKKINSLWQHNTTDRHLKHLMEKINSPSDESNNLMEH